jgi:hypothetical protein
MITVTFTANKLKAFKKAYKKAKPKEVFVFEGNEYLKEYAGYLIQYLEPKFKGVR